MTTPITTLRATLATALTNDALWQTFAYPPPTILANSVIVTPADPYIDPSNQTYQTVSPTANFRIIMTVPLLDNQGNLNGIESIVCAVFILLSNSSTISARVGSISAPSVLSVASGDLLTCDMAVSVLTSWS